MATENSTGPRVNVLDFYEPEDGRDENGHQCISLALYRAAEFLKAHGGGTVFIPKGQFSMREHR